MKGTWGTLTVEPLWSESRACCVCSYRKVVDTIPPLHTKRNDVDCSPNMSGEETIMLGRWADVIVRWSFLAGRRHLENEWMVALFLDWKKGLVVFRPSGETKAEENNISCGLYLGSKLKWRRVGVDLESNHKTRNMGVEVRERKRLASGI